MTNSFLMFLKCFGNIFLLQTQIFTHTTIQNWSGCGYPCSNLAIDLTEICIQCHVHDLCLNNSPERLDRVLFELFSYLFDVLSAKAFPNCFNNIKNELFIKILVQICCLDDTRVSTLQKLEIDEIVKIGTTFAWFHAV